MDSEKKNMDLNEIERKWFVRKENLPKLANKSIRYERYFLFISKEVEIRVQKKGEIYEFERKVIQNTLNRSVQKFEISQEEFNVLKKCIKKSKCIIRECYKVESDPQISIKVYRGNFHGLIRAEVEFESENVAKLYHPPSWFGKEITNIPLGKDKDLILLSKQKCNLLMKKCTE